MDRSVAAAALLLTAFVVLLAALSVTGEPLPASGPRTPAPVLPGIQPGGEVLLPNQWALRPVGKQLPLGDFPVNLALHPSGQWLAVLHGGYGEHEVVLVDLNRNRPRITCRVPVQQSYLGLCFTPDGRTLLASGGEFEVVHAFAFEAGLLSRHRELPVARVTDKFVPAGLAVDRGGHTLFAAGPWGDAVCLLPLDNPDNRQTIALDKDSYPVACAVEPNGKHLFVSLWNKAAVAVIDLDEKKVIDTWPTEKHPTEMVLTADGKTLFVACANSTKVSVLDVPKGKGLETIACSLYPSAPVGNTPNSLSLTPDGQMLFVANADANNVAVFNVAQRGQSRPLGFIPVGWYPTSVRFNPADKRLYVANGKGLTSRANRQGPGPNAERNLGPVYQYIAGLMQGTLSIIDLPTPERMAEYSKQAYACSPLLHDLAVTADAPEGNPIPRKVGDASPIKHCIYIIKENRTYDQVFGDVKAGNGDPALCLFPEKVTPNHHKLVREFVLLDNFYCDGEVSADGHEWSMAAYATDFVEKSWPIAYRPGNLKKFGYPSEGNYEIASSAGGYIWDRCAEAGLSYRSYGEFVQNGKTEKDPSFTKVKGLEGHFDPQFRGFDLEYPDQKRADRFLEELARFEREGDMPRFIVLRLPNDHTSGTKFGAPTPTAAVADNDLALGRVVEGISASKFWKDTAIFVVEDDAQNGPDHVDAHRTVALVISPYTKRGHVDSALYSTSSMLRTMELILGLKPMSQFDAAARPMYGSFQAKAEMSGYQHVVPEVDLKETNRKEAWGSQLSSEFNLAKEDAADDLLFNEVIWRSVRGADSPMPAPVRAAFVFPHPAKDKDDDD
jgi:DNA-binding beta-propeller fold protein YncE